MQRALEDRDQEIIHLRQWKMQALERIQVLEREVSLLQAQKVTRQHGHASDPALGPLRVCKSPYSNRLSGYQTISQAERSSELVRFSHDSMQAPEIAAHSDSTADTAPTSDQKPTSGTVRALMEKFDFLRSQVRFAAMPPYLRCRG